MKGDVSYSAGGNGVWNFSTRTTKLFITFSSLTLENICKTFDTASSCFSWLTALHDSSAGSLASFGDREAEQRCLPTTNAFINYKLSSRQPPFQRELVAYDVCLKLQGKEHGSSTADQNKNNGKQIDNLTGRSWLQLIKSAILWIFTHTAPHTKYIMFQKKNFCHALLLVSHSSHIFKMWSLETWLRE